MRSCTPGNERAFSLNTVPRIRKSFAWLYFLLFGLFDVASGVCAAGAEERGDDTGSCVEAIATAREAKSAAVHGTVIHRRRCIGLLLIDLDGESSQEDARREGGVLVTPRLLLRLPRHPCLEGRHFRRSRVFRLRLLLLPRPPLRPNHLRGGSG